MNKLFFVLGLVLVAGVSAHPFSICKGVSDKMGIHSMQLTPDPPVVGQKLTVAITGAPTKDIASGTTTLAVTAFGVKIATLNFDLCKDMGLSCPLRAGETVTGTISYSIPSAAPAGVKASAQATIKDGSGNELSCVNMEVQLSSASNLRANVNTGSNLFSRETYEFMFESWKMQFAKSFENAEEYLKRLQIFADNTDKIAAHQNQNSEFTMGHNEYSHLTWGEFQTLMKLGQPMPPKPFTATHTVDAKPNVTLPTSIDWTTKGAVTGVKNQGQCGSCWAFSTTGGIEGAGFLATGQLNSLSEQQLVDCAGSFGNKGCQGGLMDNAFKYVEQQGGLCSESSYAYTGQGGSCRASSCQSESSSHVTSYVDVAQNEQALQQQVSQGVVSVAIQANQMGFQFYSGGVFTGTCGTQLDHGVLVVGYGTQSGKDFWKIKNSWGATWGEQGYILIERGLQQQGGQCGVLLSASQPTVSASKAPKATVEATVEKKIWSPCGSSSDHMHNLAVTMSPNPPVAGKPVTISVTGNLDETVTDGVAEVQMDAFGIKVLDKKMDLCKAASKAGISCPLKKGPVNISVTQTIPSSVPHGTYKGKAIITDQNKSEVTCVNLDLTI